MPTIGTATIAINVTGDPKQIGAQVARVLSRSRRPVPTQPRVRPLWERGDLFREPVYADGRPYAEDEDLEGDGD